MKMTKLSGWIYILVTFYLDEPVLFYPIKIENEINIGTHPDES